VAVLGLLFGTLGTKSHSNVGPAWRHREYYMGKVVASLEFGLW